MTKKEAKKDRKRKKIFLAIIMILFTGIVLTASTYAWFTANRTVTVESIDVNVSTSQGLQISTDAVEWKSIVTNDDITRAAWAGVRNQLPQGNGVSMAPVSTTGIVNEGLMNMYKGTVQANEDTGINTLISKKSVEENGTKGDFVAFDLFFQSTETQNIYLTSTSKVAAKAETTATGIENAARVALINEGFVEYGSSAGDAQKIKGNTAMLLWEPNANSHTTAGIDNARNVYGLDVTATGPEYLPYNGLLAEFDATANVPLNSTDEDKFAAVTTTRTPSSGIPSTAYQPVFQINEGITKVRIYMWIEGQDVDCEDHASGGSITYDLQFSIDEKA